MSPAATNAAASRSLTETISNDTQHHANNLSTNQPKPTLSNDSSSNITLNGHLNDSATFVSGANQAAQNSSANNNTIVHHLASNSATEFTTNTTTGDQHPGKWFELPKMESFVDIFSICCSTAVIFGGLIPYIPQYLKIKRSMNSDGFSTYVCLTLLVANIMRIFFWFGHRFELPLLIQSFVMIAGMLTMMEICIRVRDKNSPYVISAIGGGSNNRRRRSLMGKLSDGRRSMSPANNSECRPIYSVLGAKQKQEQKQKSKASQKAAHHSSSISDGQACSSSESESPPATPTPLSAPSSSSCSYHEQLSGPSDEIISTRILASDSLGEGPSSVAAGAAGRPVSSYDSLTQSCQASLQFSRDSGQLRKLECCNLSDFWDWDDYASYAKFMAAFTLVMGLATYLLLESRLYVESIGFLAVLTESMLGMPQLLKNQAKKSTRGMSVEMVIMWLSGDLFKTLYFVIRETPVQFYICGSIQVLVDVLILLQVFWYRRPIVTYRKLPKST